MRAFAFQDDVFAGKPPMDELRQRLAVVRVQRGTIRACDAGYDRTHTILFTVGLAQGFAQTLGLRIAGTQRIGVNISAVPFVEPFDIAAILSVDFHG